MDDRGDEAAPFAALLGAYWLESESGDQHGAVEGEHGTGLLPLGTGRAVIVAFAAVTVVAAVVAALV